MKTEGNLSVIITFILFYFIIIIVKPELIYFRNIFYLILSLHAVLTQYHSKQPLSAPLLRSLHIHALFTTPLHPASPPPFALAVLC